VVREAVDVPGFVRDGDWEDVIVAVRFPVM
jgi:hypothetical protein